MALPATVEITPMAAATDPKGPRMFLREFITRNHNTPLAAFSSKPRQSSERAAALARAGGRGRKARGGGAALPQDFRSLRPRFAHDLYRIS